MKKVTINPFSIQNVVYHLLNDKDVDNMTTLKLNILLNIINKQYKICFGDILWTMSEFFEDDGIQKSIWVDLHFGFLPEDEEFGIEMFQGQTDNRHCKLPKYLNRIVQTVKMLYLNFSNESILDVCFFTNNDISTPCEIFQTNKGFVSEFVHDNHKMLFVSFDSDCITELLSER